MEVESWTQKNQKENHAFGFPLFYRVTWADTLGWASAEELLAYLTLEGKLDLEVQHCQESGVWSPESGAPSSWLFSFFGEGGGGGRFMEMETKLTADSGSPSFFLRRGGSPMEMTTNSTLPPLFFVFCFGFATHWCLSPPAMAERVGE